MIEKKIELLKFIIGRYDHYYDSVNNKANLYLALNTFLLGGLATVYYGLGQQAGISRPCFILMTIMLILNVWSITVALMATKPYNNTVTDNKDGSLIYFGDVADYPANMHEKLFNDYNEDRQYKDLVTQTHLLAIGLKRKFKFMGTATYLLAGQILLTLIIFLLIINK